MRMEAMPRAQQLGGPLPGELEPDEGLIDAVVESIRDIHFRVGLIYHLQLGRLLLASFFDDDPTRFDRTRNKHASYRTLARRDDLPVHYSTLSTAVAVTRQYLELPEGIRASLTYTHHRALLPLRNQQTRVHLARRAVAEDLTTGALKALVARARETERAGETRGRPRLPRFEKTLRRVARTLADEASFADLEDLRKMALVDVERLADTADQAAQRFRQLEQRLRRHLDQVR